MFEKIIRSHLAPKEDFILGFADLEGIIPESFGDFTYGVSIGKRLNDKIVDSAKRGPTLEYYLHSNQTNAELAELTHKISRDLKILKVEILEIPPTVADEETNNKYYQTLSLEFSHKIVGTRAGLGWIGKTDLFVSKKFGTRVKLVSMLTKSPLGKIAKPIEKSYCESCNLCLIKCPAKAANGIPWDITIKRDVYFNARKCRDMCEKMGKERLKMDVRICGICVAVCPLRMIK